MGISKQRSIDGLTFTVHSRWKTASRCASGVCVEVQQQGVDLHAIRDTKQSGLGPAQPQILVSTRSFRSLFDELLGRVPVGSNDEIDVRYHPDGDTTLRCRSTGIELRFDAAEIAVFADAMDEFIPFSFR